MLTEVEGNIPGDRSPQPDHVCPGRRRVLSLAGTPLDLPGDTWQKDRKNLYGCWGQKCRQRCSRQSRERYVSGVCHFHGKGIRKFYQTFVCSYTKSFPVLQKPVVSCSHIPAQTRKSPAAHGGKPLRPLRSCFTVIWRG
jgi:hypothetical protein